MTNERGSSASRIALGVLVIAAPGLLTCALLATLFHATLFDYFPSVSDELAYYQQIAAFVRAGFDGGYFTFYEHPAPLAATHFSVHGPAFPVMYGAIGRLVGWGLASGPIVNLGVLAAATAVFLVMARASLGQIAAAGVVILTSWWVILMVSITMQETLNQAFMIAMAGCAARLLHPQTRRPRLVLLAALALLAPASVLRPTNWIVAVPLVLIGSTRTRPARVAAAVVGAGLGIPAFWLIWRYVSAPVPGLAIDLAAVSDGGAVGAVSRYFVGQFSTNVAKIFDLRAFLSQPFFQHAMFESVALAGVSAALLVVTVSSKARDSLPFKVDLFNACSLGTALIAFCGFYFDSEASISRVTAPFLLMSLLVLVATGCRKWMLAVAVAANVLVVPSFLSTYRDWRVDLYTYDRQRFERFRTQLSPLVTFDAAKSPWCNTLLTMSYDREIVAVPAGIGLSVGVPPDAVAAPIKSGYLLLNGDGPEQYRQKAHLQHLGTTMLGELYRNLDAACQ